MLSGSANRVPDGGHEGVGRVVLVHHGERWVGEGAERDRRHAQEPAERAGDVRAEDRCQPQAPTLMPTRSAIARAGLLDARPASGPTRMSGRAATSSPGRVTDPRRRP